MQTSSESSLLNTNLSAALAPALTFFNASGVAQAVPGSSTTGFSVHVTVALPFEALSSVLSTFLHGKRLVLTEGFINQHVVLNGCKLYSHLENKLTAEVAFSGSFTGIFYVTGTPFYNPLSRQIELQNVAYDLNTKNLLLKGAKWLFGNLILDEIKKHSAVDLTNFYSLATARVTEALNNQWAKGIQATGSVTTLTVSGITVQPAQLLMQAQCNGELHVTVSELHVSL